MGRRIAYLTAEYMRISPFVFIHREIRALRGLGLEIGTFSIRGQRPGDELAPTQLEEKARTSFILPIKPWTVAAAHLRLLATRPVRYLRTMARAFEMRQPGCRGLLYQFFYFLEAGVLAGRLERGGFVHLHNHMASSSATVASLAAFLAGISFSFTLHGSSIRTEPHRWRIDLKAAMAKFVVCVSEFGRRHVEALVAASDREKLHVVHCGIEPDEFTRARTESGSKRMLFIGRPEEAKGLDVLLEAMASLAKRHVNVALTIVGDAPTRPDFEHRVRELELSDFVTFLGQQDPAQIRELLPTMDLFVLPSRAEGIPVSIMEAMATGLPVVATDISGIPELVEHGHNGLLVPPNDVQALEQSLDRLLSAPNERKQMGEEGRKKVVAEFDVDIEARRLAALFQQTIEAT